MKLPKPRKPSGIRPRLSVPASALLALAVMAASCSSPSPPATVDRVSGGLTGSYVVDPGIHKIRHIIIIMQENRSFDSYFGTFPGADGIPMRNGVPTVCVRNPATHRCVRPYPDHADVNGGGPHGVQAANMDIHNGKMNGFIASIDAAPK